MQGRPAGRIGIPFGPRTGRANGLFRLAEILVARKSTGWPIDSSAQASSRVAPAIASSATEHLKFTQVKTDGGTLA